LKKKITQILFLLTLGTTYLYGQELPPILTYSPKDYGAENQNWGISQANDNYIYVANNKGLLEFNGAKWRLYPTPNETIMRSVKFIEGKIFTGFYMDFGYWIKNKFGTLEYTSISKEKNISIGEDEQFWTILELDGWLLFQSLERIYLYNISTEEVKIIKAKSTITKMIKVDGAIYFQELGKGIYKIEKGQPKLISDSIEFKNFSLVNLFKEGDSLIFLMQNKGFLKLENHKVSSWKEKTNAQLKRFTIYSGLQLENRDFVLGTISHGIVYLTNNGEILYQIDQKKGLTNNTVLSLFNDKNKNIWIGLDNGINVINTNSPYKTYNNNNGDIGTVYASIVDDNNLYIGTNQGLFVKSHNENKFKFIKNTQGQVWNLIKIGEDLFCGHNSGTFIIKGDSIVHTINLQGTWDIKSLSNKLLLQGNYNGLNVLEKKQGKWQFRNRIEGFNNSSRYFEILDSKNIFVNHEYKGVFKITVDSSFNKALEVKKNLSVNKGANSGLIKFQKQIYYSYKKGVFKYNSQHDTFEKDSILNRFFIENEYATGKLILNKQSDKIWSFSKNSLSYMSPGKLSSTPLFHKIYLSENIKKGASGYENITQVGKNQYLLGISDGYIIINTKDIENNKDFNVNINSIKNTSLKGVSKEVHISGYSIFNNSENTLDISYSSPVYNKFSKISYQYKLSEQQNKWSPWSQNSNAQLKNLKYGDYTFKVRAKIGNTLSANEASYRFKIHKPWFVTNLMIGVYVCVVLLFSFFMHIVYKNYYKKQRERLLEKQQREFELKTLETEQKLMRYKNDQLRSDVESKNRELATSTMSIIKKNEFLNELKKELKNSEENKNNQLNKVIKIIDKDLNNTDDWKLFKEAFNNADKDFIKKIKTKHSVLTPNDLRLCAYLRLNLSSKEIAPLLNISPKSVEVKRYRLRKKINLPHESNLIDYILKI
jgi:DNA-binding CsgD family transcriptional regulator/ligand-binding sensor domain-containing protein